MTPLPLAAEQLSIERLLGDPALSGPAPREVKIAPDGSRVGFLRGRAHDQFQLDLWEYNLRDDSMRLLVDSKRLVPDERLSEAEKARRERSRTADLRGITGYDWSPDGRRLLFPLGEALYLHELDSAAGAAPRKLAEGSGILDAQISPQGRYASFVRAQNLYVVELSSGRTQQLTHDGGGSVFNGEAEFVAQEEMDQRHGYWWAPDDSAIAFKQYDESAVPLARRFEIYADRTEIVEQRYPAAGGPNVRLRLGLVAPQGGAPRWIDLGPEPDIYLPRVDWTRDAATLTYQRQSRNQQQLQLVSVDTASLRQKPLLAETSQTWINLHDDLRFLARQQAFVWASERSGSKHLYLYRNDGRLLHAITRGDWNVDALEAVDEHAGRVWFSSNKDRTVGKQLYTARLDGRDAGQPQRVGSERGWHDLQFARNADRVTLYVDRYSDATTPPQTSVRAPDGRLLAWIEENRFDTTHPMWPYRALRAAPDFGTLEADDGQSLRYRLRKPPGFDPARRYPVVVMVYGGPGVQTVADAWEPTRHESLGLYLAQQGYVVFALDNRGSARRGRRFENAIHLRMGDAEVRDQIAGIEWLRAQPWVEPGRIGVYGWSYGGYMTLQLLGQAPKLIAAGAAGAPVTDWKLYDTHYTERYLGRPQDNTAGYAASSVFAQLERMGSPLLLIHGMADDNVLFLHSTQLIAALQQRGTQFELMTYPGGKHALSSPQMKQHVYRLITDFFDRRLKAAEH